MEFAAAFLTGLTATGKVMCLFLGGASAVLLALIGVLILAGILAGLFDLVTWLIARRLAKSKREPRSKLGKILVGSVRREPPAL